MAEQNKQINVRLINKYDTENNWKSNASEYIAPAGELIISSPTKQHNYPTIRVGDSTNVIADLPIINSQPRWKQEDSSASDFIVDKPPITELEDGKGIKVGGEGHVEAKVVQSDSFEVTSGDTTKCISHYTNTTPMPTAVGGLAAGTTFENKNLAELLDELLYPYVAPTNIVLSMTLSPEDSDKIYKRGRDRVTVSDVNLSYNKKSNDITNAELHITSTQGTYIIEGELSNSGVNFPLTIDQQSYVSDVSFKGTIYDGVSSYNSNEIKLYFVDPVYFGVAANEEFTQVEERICRKGTLTSTFTTDNSAPVIRYPKEYGELSKIIDPNNFSQAWDKTETSIEDVEYYQYIGSVSTAANVKYTFQF